MSITTWEKIYDQTLSSAATSVTISNLTGDTDLEYKLEARIVNGYNGATNLYLRLNNDDTAANYGFQWLYANNITAYASRNASVHQGIQFTLSALNYITMFTTKIFAKSGYVRTCISEVSQDITESTVIQLVLKGDSYSETATEITRIDILADQTNGFGVGSQIVLWRRKTINLITSSESTIKNQGTYALKCVAGATSTLNKTLTKTF